MRDYYEILDIPPQASENEIKKRFRFLSHAYHPDKFATDEQKNQAVELFKLKTEAYQVLSVKERRTLYDKKRNKGRRSTDDRRNNDVGDVKSIDSSLKNHKNRQKKFLIGFGILAIVIAGVAVYQSSRGRDERSSLFPAIASTALQNTENSPSVIKTVSSIDHDKFPIRDTFRNPHKEAAKKYLKDAKQGSATLQISLAFMYYVGRGVDQDYSKAAEWYRRAAEQGHIRAQFNIGVMYFKGQGVMKDYSEAARWYRRAAEQKYPQAQNILGLMYSRGQGVKQDYEEAVKWYLVAAEQGYAQAQKNLSVMYLEGRGVEKDQKEAIRWRLKAIEKR